MKKISELIIKLQKECEKYSEIMYCPGEVGEIFRADAIKDIKELQKRINILSNHKGNCMSNNCIQCDNIIDMQSVIKYLKFKHNLKDDDLLRKAQPKEANE